MPNITVEKNTYKVDPLYQWDINQVLQIYGLSLSTIPEIHFTNEAMERAIVRQATMDETGVIRVDIPNSLLQKPYTINAYICIYEGETFKSLYSLDIPIKPRKKPSDYTIVDDEEIYSFNAIENLVNNTIVTLTAKCDETIASVNKGYNKAIEQLNKKCDETIEEINNVKENAVEEIESIALNLDSQIDEIRETAETAEAIAKGKNQAHVFSTTESMNEFLSNPDNAGLYQVGDNIYIVDTDVPDWWVSEVLTEADADTGFYYKIAQLETQKVDLTEYDKAIRELTNNFVYSTNEQEYGKWIDGKTLYRKMVIFTNTELNENFQTDIPSNTIDTVFIGGNSFCNKDVTYSPLNLSHTNTKDTLGALCSKAFENISISVRNAENGLGWTYYVELFYTKI